MAFIRVLALSILTITISAGSIATASTKLTQKEILARCYAQLTGKRLPSSDARWARLGSVNAAELCSNLLSEVSFNAEGVLQNSASQEQRLVLKQFHDLHRAWFDRQLFEATQLGEQLWGTIDIYEAGQPSFHITKAAFSNAPYKTVLSGSDYLIAARDPTGIPSVGSASGFLRPSRALRGGDDGDARAPLNTHTVVVQSVCPTCDTIELPTVPLVQVGPIVGIKVANEPYFVSSIYGDTNKPRNPDGMIAPHNLHQSFGAGALGSQGFLLSTFGHGFDYSTNGASKLPRRWIQSAIKVFLCRPDGYLRDEDIGGYLRTTPESPTFRQAQSCLKCHATMDQAAMTARNLTPAATGFLMPYTARMAATIAAYPVSQGAQAEQEFWPSTPVSNFKYQAPVGKFYFRTMNGDLIDKQVSNLEELGQAMTSIDDYYACAASRYVEYFTGVKVPIIDPGNSSNALALKSQTESDKKWRAFVVQLGQKLKNGGTIKSLVGEIFSSEFYQSSSFGR